MNQDQIISELYKLSLKAYQNDEVPIACVIVKNKKIVSKAYNLREKHKNPLYHAEVLAINKLCKKINNWRLDEYEMYVTLKPCKMCMEIIKESRIKKVYIGTMDEKTGAVGSVFNLFEDYTFNHKPGFNK